ncbi:MAG: sigma-70 family RNA polymerase sigma factor [Vicinamibacterales bacterium]
MFRRAAMWQDAVSVNAPRDSSDADLIRRIVLRDERALADLYDRHGRLVYSVAMRILCSASDAEEVLQETFVRVWARGSTYEPTLGSPAAWLTRIARNCAIDRTRARKARYAVNAAPVEPEIAGTEPSTDVTPEAVFEDRSTSVAVRGALQTLPPPQRTLIEAAFFEGYMHQELSEAVRHAARYREGAIRTGLLALRTQLQAV